LWLPTETDLSDSGLNSLISSSSSTEPFLRSLKIKSPKNLSKTSKTTSWQSLQFLPPDTMEAESIENQLKSTAEGSVYCRKVRIYPRKEQVELFNKCIGATRYFYNQANAYVKNQISEVVDKRMAELEALKEHGCVHHIQKRKKKAAEGDEKVAAPPPVQCKKPIVEGSKWFCKAHQETGTLGIKYDFLQLNKLRKAVMLSNEEIEKNRPDLLWQTEVPYNTRQLALKELITSYESAFALKKAGYCKSFDISFKKKKSIRHIFKVDSGSFSAEKMRMFHNFMNKKVKKPGQSKLRSRTRDVSKYLQDHEESDITVLKVRPNKWYICLQKLRKPKEAAIYENPAYKSVFLDPGVRTFLTFYSPEGVCGKIGEGYYKYLQNLGARVDRLQSVAANKEEYSSKTRYRMMNRCAKLRDKIKHKVEDLHWKTCNFLCQGFQNIFIPKFEVSQMVPKGFRNIHSTTVRSMLELSHGKFRERLLYVAKTKQCNVIFVMEHFTTKTCGSCGELNETIGGSKTFLCPHCSTCIDRDYNGARNICLLTTTYC
jgi:transposase